MLFRSLAQRMSVRLSQRIDKEAQRLDQLALRLSHALPNPDRMREKAQQLSARLNQAWQVNMQNYRQRHQAWRNHLELLSPQRTLDRGYAVVLNQDGQALRDPQSLVVKQALKIHLALGNAEVELSKVQTSAKTISSE